LGQAFFPEAECGGADVSAGVIDGLSSGAGVADGFLRFDFVFGVGLGDGVGEAFFCFRSAVGDGVGVAFFAEPFLCLRIGAGVGVAKIFLIFVPNDSSAASAAQSPPNNIAKIKSHFMIEQCP
jgi:hypothetical protein